MRLMPSDFTTSRFSRSSHIRDSPASEMAAPIAHGMTGAADLAAKRSAAVHPVHPDLETIIKNRRAVTFDIVRWLGTVGGHLVGLEGPGVQPRQVRPVIRSYGGYLPISLRKMPGGPPQVGARADQEERLADKERRRRETDERM